MSKHKPIKPIKPIKTATSVEEAYAFMARGIDFDVEPEVMEEISIAAEDPMIIDEEGDPIDAR